MAVDELLRLYPDCTTYFPAYEIVCDELRDYRFYQEDMLHPSPQAVEYIWERLVESYFSHDAKRFLREWQPIKKALHHKPFHPESEAYQRFLADAQRREQELQDLYNRLQQSYQDNQAALQKAQAEKMSAISAKVMEVVKKLGEAGGYVYVVDTSAGVIPFVNSTLSTDITSQVKKELGIQ
jgi:Skp family chaperone for outer membrane proteins